MSPPVRQTMLQAGMAFSATAALTMPYFFHQHGGLGGLVIDKAAEAAYSSMNRLYRLGVLVKLAAHQQHGGNQLAVAAQGVPLLRRVGGPPAGLHLAHGHHHKGLGSSMATALS